MRKIAIIGSGAFGIQIKNAIHYDCIEPFEIIGFFDDYQEKDTLVEGYPILGKLDEIINKYKAGLFDCIFIAIGYKHFKFREELYNKLNGIVPFANIISQNAFIHPTAKIGKGVLITNFAIINANAIVDDNTCITLRSIVNHDCYVDKHTFFSTNVSTAGHVRIGKRCFIGVGCIISDSVQVGDDVWLSPGCVVGKDISSSGRYMSYSMKLSKI